MPCKHEPKWAIQLLVKEDGSMDAMFKPIPLSASIKLPISEELRREVADNLLSAFTKAYHKLSQ
jgi:hypothetical protein